MKLNNIFKLSALATIALVAASCNSEVEGDFSSNLDKTPVLKISRAASAYAPADGTILTVENNLSSDFTDATGATQAAYTYNGGVWSTGDELTIAKEASELYITSFIDTEDTKLNSFEMSSDKGVVEQGAGLEPFDYLYSQGTLDYSTEVINIKLSRVMAKINVDVVLETPYDGSAEVIAQVVDVVAGASRAAGQPWEPTDVKVSVIPFVKATEDSSIIRVTALMPAQMWSQKLAFSMGDINFTTEGKGYAVESGKEYTFTIYAGYSSVISFEGEPTVSGFKDTVVATTGNAIDTRDWDGVTLTLPEGKGTEEEPYLINTGAELAYMAERVNAGDAKFKDDYYVLMGDISLKNHEWSPIGTEKKDFVGHFDGAGYTISDIKMSADIPDDESVGFFGSIISKANASAIIKNLTLKNITLVANTATAGAKPSVGLLVGSTAPSANNGYVDIINCHVINGTLELGTASGGAFGVGGLVGDLGSARASNVIGCSIKDSKLTTAGFLGGIAGQVKYGIIHGCTVENCDLFPQVKSAGGICAVISAQNRSVDPAEPDYDSGVIASRTIGGTLNNIVGVAFSTGGIVANNYGRVWGCFSDMEITLPKTNHMSASLISAHIAHNAAGGEDIAKMFSSYTTLPASEALPAIGKSFAVLDVNVNEDGTTAQVDDVKSVVEAMNATLKAMETTPEEYFYIPNTTDPYKAKFLYDAEGDIVEVQ